MFKSQSAASDTSSQSEQDTSECTTAHSGTTTDRRSRSRSRRISLRKKLKLPIGRCTYRVIFYEKAHVNLNQVLMCISPKFAATSVSQFNKYQIITYITCLSTFNVLHCILPPYMFLFYTSACRRTTRLPLTLSVLRMCKWIHPHVIIFMLSVLVLHHPSWHAGPD